MALNLLKTGAKIKVTRGGRYKEVFSGLRKRPSLMVKEGIEGMMFQFREDIRTTAIKQFWPQKSKRMIDAINNARFKGETGTNRYRGYPAWKRLAPRTIKWKRKYYRSRAKDIWQMTGQFKAWLFAMSRRHETVTKWNVMEMPKGPQWDYVRSVNDGLPHKKQPARPIFVFTKEDIIEWQKMIDGVLDKIIGL